MTTAPAAQKAFDERAFGLNALGWVVFFSLLALWQIGATVAASPSTATFTEAVAAAVQLLTGPPLITHILPSLARMLAGFAIAAISGIVVGLVIGTFRRADPWVRPSLEFFRAVPPSLIIPIVLLVFGLGDQLVIFVISFGAFWPVLLNTIDGARRVEPLFLETARSLRLSVSRTLVSVIIPAALPTILAGLRVALSISLILMVVAEVLASNSGIGYLISLSQQTFDVTGTYGGVLLLATIGWLFDTLFVLIERRVLRSHNTRQVAHSV